MGLLEILGIVIIVMLLGIMILQIMGRRKSDISEISSLLKRTAEEQRNDVQKQIASGATEQFERFGVIQKSIQNTLSTNRDEVNRQLCEFQQQMETKLTVIQKAATDSNEQIGRTITTALQESRKEQNNQLHTFGEQVDSRLSSIQRANTENIEKINTTLENKMKELQESNEKRLEQIQDSRHADTKTDFIWHGRSQIRCKNRCYELTSYAAVFCFHRGFGRPDNINSEKSPCVRYCS